MRAKQIRETRGGKLSKLRELCAQKAGYLGEHPRAKVQVAKRIAEKKAEKLKIDSLVDIRVRGRALKVEVKEKAWEEEEKLDGCYVIKTDLSVETASTQTVHDRYKDLSEVEWAFRTMKTGLLHLRGIYVRKAKRTRVHVFTVMLAYLIAYELQRLWRDVEVTIGEGIGVLSTLCATEVIIGDVSVQTVPEPGNRVGYFWKRRRSPCLKLSPAERSRCSLERNLSKSANCLKNK